MVTPPYGRLGNMMLMRLTVVGVPVMRATLVAASERVSKQKKAMGTDPRTGREKRNFCRVATTAACITCQTRLLLKMI